MSTNCFIKAGTRVTTLLAKARLRRLFSQPRLKLKNPLKLMEFFYPLLYTFIIQPQSHGGHPG